MSNSTESTITFKLYFYTLLYALTVFSLCGNILVIIIITRSKCFDSINSALFTSQATSDFFLSLVYSIYNTSHMDNHYVKKALASFYPCFIFATLLQGMIMISSWNLVFITVVRFISIRSPLHFYNYVTPRRTRICIAILWFGFMAIAVSLHLYYLFEKPAWKENICQTEKYYDVIRFTFISLTNFFIPAVVMAIMHAYLLITARRKVMLEFEDTFMFI